MGKGGKKGSLKAALSSQQSRLKKKQEAVQAIQHSERTKNGPPSKGKGKAAAVSAPVRVTVPFSSTDRILLIGEGNFSFARALACSPPSSLQFLPPSNITATAYDTEEECCSKYPEAAEMISSLREKGVKLLFSVDATRLEKCAPLRGTKYNKIVWNFPHAGKEIVNSLQPVCSNVISSHSGKGIADQDRNILSNQVLLLGFLSSAASFLVTGPVPIVHAPRKRKRGPDDDESGDDDERSQALVGTRPSRGSLLITLRNVSPYSLW